MVCHKLGLSITFLQHSPGQANLGQQGAGQQGIGQFDSMRMYLGKSQHYELGHQIKATKQMKIIPDVKVTVINHHMAQQKERFPDMISGTNQDTEELNDKDEQRQGASHARRAGEHLGAQCAIFQHHEDARPRSNC